MDSHLENIVEAIIFASDQPVKMEDIQEILQKSQDASTDNLYNFDSLEQILLSITTKYTSSQYPFEVKKVANGYQFFTKPVYYPYIKQAVINKNQKKLSKAALETLSIIAYKQPVTKTEVEHIRGVNSDYAVQKLLEKKLINIAGRASAPGKPLLYATSEFFLQYLGINEIEDLPKLKEFEPTAEEKLTEFQTEN